MNDLNHLLSRCYTSELRGECVWVCAHLSRSYGLGKPCSSRLRTLLIAATVGCDRDVSRSVSSNLGISWNSRSSLAFLAASLFEQNTDLSWFGFTQKKPLLYLNWFLKVWFLPGFCQQFIKMLKERQMKFVWGVKPDLRGTKTTMAFLRVCQS